MARTRAGLPALRATGTATQTFMEGIRLMNKGRAGPEQMAKGVALVREAAGAGCLDAQTCMGQFCADGIGGTPRDMSESMRWFEKAGEAGHASANYNLGVLKLNGRGVPQDKRTAAKHFKAAGEAGHQDSMTNLAMMLVKGDGLPRDLQLGAQWLVKAAKTGNTMEELMDNVQSGNLDTETKLKLSEHIEKLRDVNWDKPYENTAAAVGSAGSAATSPAGDVIDVDST